MKKIVLASNSPRRREILKKANIDFAIKTANCNEHNFMVYDEQNVRDNSLNKALCVLDENIKNALIISADTVVILDSVCIVKPRNFFEAIFMLKKLSNKTHKVVTSHTILNSDTKKSKTEISVSFVTFYKLSYFKILKYLILKRPFDKAGSYGIQDFLDAGLSQKMKGYIKELRGSYYNVMGLDIDLIKDLIKQFDN